MQPQVIKKRKIKFSHLLNIILTIILVATIIFAYLYLNSKTITALEDIEQVVDPKPPKFLANLYGRKGSYLDGPLAVTVNKDEKIIVADSGNSKIQLFDTHGKFLTRFGQFGSNPTQLNYPTSIATNSEGLIYIGDFNNNRIQVYSEKGTLINTIDQKAIGEVISPLALAIDEEDYLYIANRTGKIIVLDRNGNLKLSFGKAGSKDGYLSYPNGIAVGPSKHIYISDSGNFRVQVFDENGKFLKSIDQQGIKTAVPKGIAVDSNEWIYIVDNFQHRVNVFDKDWKYLFSFGIRGLNEGELNYPNGIFVKSNKVYITDRENDRIAIFGY